MQRAHVHRLGSQHLVVKNPRFYAPKRRHFLLFRRFWLTWTKGCLRALNMVVWELMVAMMSSIMSAQESHFFWVNFLKRGWGKSNKIHQPLEFFEICVPSLYILGEDFFLKKYRKELKGTQDALLLSLKVDKGEWAHDLSIYFSPGFSPSKHVVGLGREK